MAEKRIMALKAYLNLEHIPCPMLLLAAMRAYGIVKGGGSAGHIARCDRDCGATVEYAGGEYVLLKDIQKCSQIVWTSD